MSPSPSTTKITAALLLLLSSASALPALSKRSIWTPAAGTTWQIELSQAPPDTSINAAVYDIDLFDNTAATIQTLHNDGRKVICYFSAGTWENWRPDEASFQKADIGSKVAGWKGENWLNTRSTSVRSLMAARMDLAVQKGCNGVDPDNIDAYDNGGGGFSLTTSDATDYVNFLASTAHAKGLAVGLKNGGDIITSAVIGEVDFAVNEQCVQYSECDTWTPFITAGKPVFHIEYPKGAGPNGAGVSAQNQEKYCQDPSEAGFSTVLKDMDLDDWLIAC